MEKLRQMDSSVVQRRIRWQTRWMIPQGTSTLPYTSQNSSYSTVLARRQTSQQGMVGKNLAEQSIDSGRQDTSCRRSYQDWWRIDRECKAHKRQSRTKRYLLDIVSKLTRQ